MEEKTVFVCHQVSIVESADWQWSEQSAEVIAGVIGCGKLHKGHQKACKVMWLELAESVGMCFG